MLGFGGAPLGKLLFDHLDACGEPKHAEHFGVRREEASLSLSSSFPNNDWIDPRWVILSIPCRDTSWP